MAIVNVKMESDFDMMTFATCTIVGLTSGHTLGSGGHTTDV